MKTKAFFKLLAFATVLSIFSIGCQRESIQEQMADQTSYAKSAPSVTLDSDTPEGANCCSVFGQSQPICLWAADVNSVLNCCYAETPSGNCQWQTYPQPYYQTATYEIHATFPNYPESASVMNSHISQAASFAIANKPNNFKIYGFTVDAVYTGGGYCTMLRVNITYRRYICEAVRR